MIVAIIAYALCVARTIASLPRWNRVHTCEVDIPDVLEQQRAVDGFHPGAQADLPGTQIFVHVVQSVSHGVNCVDHELNLPLLFVG